MSRICTMRQALEDPDIFGTILPGETWAKWRVVLIASQGEPLTDAEREVYQELTGREREPDQPCDEVWGVIGRRGGKTRAFAVAAAYFAGCVDYTGLYAPGQRLKLPVMAATTMQANDAFRYLYGIFTQVEMFAAMLDGEPTQDTIRLADPPLDIVVTPANFRTGRSGTYVAVVCDEIAFWFIEGSANPDREILRAVRPGLITTGGPLFVLSSPYAKKGELYAAHKRDFGPAGDPRVMVLQAPILAMHRSAKIEREVARAYERDPESARAEYGAEFRADLQDFVSPETVDACTSSGIEERGYISRTNYRAFVDMAGGGADSATLAIGHREGDVAMLDAMREMPAGSSPEASVETFAAVVKAYGLSRVSGDRYAGEWPRERFRAHGIEYEVSGNVKSDIYREFLPLLNSRRVELLDLPKLKAQIIGLERRTARGGRDSIDHVRGAHDDLANAAAGVLVDVAARPRYGMMDVVGEWPGGKPKTYAEYLNEQMT